MTRFINMALAAKIAAVLCLMTFIGTPSVFAGSHEAHEAKNQSGASEASAQQAADNAQEDVAKKPSSWYLNAALGLSSILEEDAPDTGVAGGIAVGRKFNPVSLELAAALYSNEIEEEDVTLETSVTTLNVLLDIPVGNRTSFNVGAGLGIAQYEVLATLDDATVSISPDETDLALAVPLGVKYRIADKWALGLKITHAFIFIDDETLNYRSITFGVDYLF